MAYIEPKTDFKDGDVLHGVDLNASNETIKAGVDDNFDRIQGLEASKQDVLTAGTGIEITEDNVINNTQTSAEWGNIQGDITDQEDLQSALGNKVDKVEGKDLSTNDYDDTAKNIVDNVTTDLAGKVDKVSGKQLSTEDYTTAEKTKLSGIDSGAEANIIETVKVDGTALTPDADKAVNIDLSGKINEPSSEGTDGQVLTTDGNGGRTWTTVQGGGGGGTSNYNDLNNKPKINNVTLSGNKSLSDLGINIPTKLSDLTNDNNTVTDADYVHTDNNYTSAEKTKLSDIESGAEVNDIDTIKVNGTTQTISNKEVNISVPTKLSDLTNDNNTVTDANYVHTDNNYTSTEKTKLSGIEAGAQVNVDEIALEESAITNDTKLLIEEDDLGLGSQLILEDMPVGSQMEFTGSTIPAGWEEVNDYSTNEIDTGKKWIDGKKIYRKVVNFGALPNNGNTTKAHNLSNVTFINYYGVGISSNGSSYKLPYVSTNDISSCIEILITSTNISISTGTNRSGLNGYIVLEYTKTS